MYRHAPGRPLGPTRSKKRRRVSARALGHGRRRWPIERFSAVSFLFFSACAEEQDADLVENNLETALLFFMNTFFRGAVSLPAHACTRARRLGCCRRPQPDVSFFVKKKVRKSAMPMWQKYLYVVFFRWQPRFFLSSFFPARRFFSRECVCMVVARYKRRCHN